MYEETHGRENISPQKVAEIKSGYSDRVATHPGFPGMSWIVPCCPASQQDQPRNAKYPGFQGMLVTKQQ